MKPEGRSKILDGNYRVTRTEFGLEVETLDYHAGPVTISFEDLKEFGLVKARGSRREKRRRPEVEPGH